MLEQTKSPTSLLPTSPPNVMSPVLHSNFVKVTLAYSSICPKTGKARHTKRKAKKMLNLFQVANTLNMKLATHTISRTKAYVTSGKCLNAVTGSYKTDRWRTHKPVLVTNIRQIIVDTVDPKYTHQSRCVPTSASQAKSWQNEAAAIILTGVKPNFITAFSLCWNVDYNLRFDDQYLPWTVKCSGRPVLDDNDVLKHLPCPHKLFASLENENKDALQFCHKIKRSSSVEILRPAVSQIIASFKEKHDGSIFDHRPGVVLAPALPYITDALVGTYLDWNCSSCDSASNLLFERCPARLMKLYGMLDMYDCPTEWTAAA